jgi:hypothetical protein
MAAAQEATGRCAPWPKDALRVSFGIIWLIDATLKWLPGFRAGYMGTIMAEAQGQPGWLKPWFDFWIRFQHPYAMPLAYLVAGHRDADRARSDRRVRPQAHLHLRDRVQPAHLGHRRRVRRPVHRRRRRHRHRHHLRGRVRRPARAELLRRPSPLQRRLLHREEGQLVVEGRRDAPLRPG